MNLYKSRKKKDTIPVTGISLDKSEIENYMGNTSTVKVIVTPSNATHKNNYQVAIGDVEDADKVGTTFTKEGDTITIHFNGKSGGDEYYFLNGQVWYRQITKNIPVVVSLDGVSAIFYITMKPRGSYVYHSSVNPIYPLVFNKIKNSTSNSNNIQLLQTAIGSIGAYGSMSVDDTMAEYRTGLDRFYYNNASLQLYNSLVSFPKVVHKTLTTSTTYNAKYHLIALGEIGCTISTEDKQYGNIINLGNDTYPSIMSNPDIMGINWYVPRNIWKDTFSSTPEPIQMEIDFTCVNNNDGYAWGMSVDDESINYMTPIICLPYDLSVIKLGTAGNIDYYEIDYSGTSSLKLSSVPLGSKIFDLSGLRNGEMNLFVDNIQTGINTFVVGIGQSLEISAKMFEFDESVNQNFTVSISNSHATVAINGNVIVLTGVSKGRAILTIINTSNNGITKRRELRLWIQ